MELFSALCDHVKATEPGALSYQSYTTQGANLEPMIIFLEKYASGPSLVANSRAYRSRYENQAAFEKHRQGTKFAEVFGIITAEGIMEAPPKIFTMKKGPGYTQKD